jgi:hypothetical protein
LVVVSQPTEFRVNAVMDRNPSSTQLHVEDDYENCNGTSDFRGRDEMHPRIAPTKKASAFFEFRIRTLRKAAFRAAQIHGPDSAPRH